MLIPGFYTIEDFQVSKNHVHAQIRLNPNHDVYEGHFPGQPVVPGVIQLQIIKEVLEKAINQKLLLAEMTFAKYLNTVIPDNSPVLILQVAFIQKENGYSFSAIIKDEALVYTKVKGTLSFIFDKPAL